MAGIQKVGEGGELPVEIRGASYQPLIVTARTVDGRSESEQKIDARTQLPLWSVVLLVLGVGEPAQMAVTIPAAQKPATGGFVDLVGLRVGVWSMNGKSGLYWRADSARAKAPERGDHVV